MALVNRVTCAYRCKLSFSSVPGRPDDEEPRGAAAGAAQVSFPRLLYSNIYIYPVGRLDIVATSIMDCCCQFAAVSMRRLHQCPD
eukprot:COSAG02_NODE_3343_length_6898_cov_9.593617_10_plen_85_part_00